VADTPASALLSQALDVDPTAGPRLPAAGPSGRDPGISDLPPAPTETLAPIQPPPGAAPPTNLPVSTVYAEQSVRANAVAARANLAYREAVTRRTGAGAELPQPQEQRDLDTMSASDLRARYGSARALQMMSDRVSAEGRLNRDLGGERSLAEAAADFAVDVPTAAVSGVGNIASFLTGLVSSDAGTALASGVQSFNDWARTNQTESLQGRQRVGATRAELAEEANTAQFERDIADGTPRPLAHLARIGRGAVDGTLNLLSDPQTFGSGVGQGVGSLVTGAPVARVLAAIGSRILPSLSLTTVGAMPAAIGLLEGGGAYQQTVQEVMGMSPADLSQNSPAFREMIRQGVSPADAQRRVANEAGIMAGTIQAPVAALIGRVTGAARFEATPFRVPTLRTGARNLGIETTEEGLQSASGQVSQNLGVQTFADERQSLSEGVGEQAAQGAILGFATAGAVQAPGASARVVGNAAGAGISAAGRGVAALAEAVADYRRAPAPVATSTVAPDPVPPDSAASTTPTETAPGTVETPTPGSTAPLAPVVEPTATSAPPAPSLVPPEAPPEASLPPRTPPTVSDDLAPVVRSDEPVLRETLESTPADNVIDVRDAYQETLAGGRSTDAEGPTIQMDLQGQIARQLRATGQPVRVRGTDGTVHTITGRKNREFVNAQGNPVPIQTIAPNGWRPEEVATTRRELPKDEKGIAATLKQEEDGFLKLTDDERNSLRTAYSVLKADREAAERMAEAGIDTPVVRVSNQVLSNAKSEQGFISAAEHVAGISEAFRAKDYTKARDLMRRFGEFAKHMNNKLEAINESLSDGKKRGFRAYNNLLDKWYDTGPQVFGNPGSAKSVQLAQLTQIEAAHLVEIFNGLSKAFPTLGMGTLSVSTLDPRLRGKLSAFDASDAQPKIETKSAPKAEPKTEETKPADAPPVVTPTTTTAPVVEAPVRTPTVQEVYPDLLGFIGGKVRDFFSKAFKISSKPKTRFAQDSSPLAYVQETLGSLEGWVTRVGEKHSKRLTPEVSEAYMTLLEQVPLIRARMEKNLAEFLQRKRESGNDAGKTTQERLLEGRWINGMVEGKALNITDVNTKGNITYNNTLVESALLASMNWLINLSSGSNQIQQEDLETMLGREVEENEVNDFNKGVMKDTLVRSLAQRLTEYWSVSTNPDAPVGISQGIAEAVAVEIIVAMQQMNLLKSETIEIQALENGELVPRSFVFFNRAVQFDEAITAFPSAIEEASLVEPTVVHYYDGAKPPVAKTQLNNGDVPTTSKQRLMMQRASAVEYRPNMTMANFYQLLTRNGFRDLFGNGDLESKTLNAEDRASLDGQNRSLMAAYDSFQAQMAEMANIAAATGKQVADVTMRYAFGITRVGRLQMLGAQNPQSTKAIREVFLSTWSKLDMTTAAHKSLFNLALGQALGVKVHQKTRDQVAEDVAKLLSALDPVVQILRSVGPDLELDGNTIQTIKDTFSKAGLLVTPLAIHALAEQAKLMDNDPKSFETSLYVEADGVTNGVVNAMMLLSSGGFNETWLKTMGKGGLLTREAIDTMNKQHTSDGGDRADIYTAVRDELDKTVQTRWANSPHLSAQFALLKELMGVLLPDVTIDSNGNIEFKRGITKNPVTISLYGSSANGIAGKMVKLLEEQIASKMSLYAQAENMEPDAATMHVWGVEGKGRLKLAQWYETKFLENMAQLTSTYTRMNKETGRLQVAQVREDVLQPLSEDPKTFKLTPERRKALRANMKYLFVDPMMQSMSAVIGESLLANAQTLRKATQVQSIILEHMFKDRVRAKIEQKQAADPEYMASHFLSQVELKEILDDLRKISPDIIGQDQVFFLSGTTRQEFTGTEFVRAMRGDMSVVGTAYGPRDIGVGGVPVLNIAYGDGQMIQQFMTYPGAVDGVLPIFDGINMPLTTLESLSERANRAVWDSWKGNPVKDVNVSFQTFLSNLKPSDLTPAMLRQLRYSLFGYESRNDEKITLAQIQAEIAEVGAEVTRIAQSVDDRTAVVNNIAVSVDQMASAGAPYKTPGTVSLDLPANEAVALLNRQMAEIASARRTEKGVAAAISTMGRKDKVSGARVISPKSVAKLFQTAMEMPYGQQQVLREIFRGADLFGYKIVYGTASELNAYQQAVGDEVTSFSVENGVTHGVTSTGSKTIYLFSPTSETFTHEMVHAATFMKLQAMLEGTIDNEISREILKNLRALSEQFLTMEETFLGMSNAAHTAWNNATSAMLRAENEATRLNEFMAWALANKDLAEGARTVPSVVQWLKNVLDTIKQVIFGRKRITKPEEDFFSNLLFTSSVIMRTQPTVAEQAKQATLFMSTVFGSDTRLNRVQDLFDNLFLKFANEPKSNSGKAIRRNAIDQAVHKAKILSFDAITNGFAMNTQEKNLFQNIVAAFATSMQITPTSVAEIEAYYRHVMKNLKVEDFMSDPTSLDPNVRAAAQKKYDVLAGNSVVMKDVRNRTTLMPVFLGLAMIDSQFRSVLEKMPTIAVVRDESGTLDARLDNAGTAAMELLSNQLSGTKGTNVQQAIDALVDNIHETTQDKLGFIETYVGPVGRGIDWMNEKVVYGITKLADTVIQATENKSSATTNPYAKFLLGTTNMLAKLTTERRAEDVSLGVMHALNRSDGWVTFRAFMSDLVGRTNENKGIYDLIKAVKTAVSQIRQQFREQLPKTIRASFTRELSEQEWTTLYRALGKTDLASLLGSMNRSEVLRLVQNEKSLQAEIDKLERDLAAQDLTHFAQVQRKAKQLAGYMMGKAPGQLLLRNAESIARLHMHTKATNRPTVTRGYIQAVDSLVTLYAFQKLSKDEKAMFNTLVVDEAKGVDFSFAYMLGQRTDEMAKATGKARFNALKGYIASASQEGASLIVADTKEAARLLEMGYQKVADYAGSRLDPNREKKAYYFAPVSGRAPYNQGVYQNVRETSGGVDTGTGFTYHGMTAGVIADPREVAEINKALLRGAPSGELETLIPVIGDLGVAIAYERAVNAQHLTLTKPSTNFADMLGVWRGRQAEEAVAQIYNEQLNKALYDMWSKAKPSEQKAEYVNILDPKQIDPVVRDAVGLMTYATKQHAMGLFGKDTIMVRRDMLNDTLGYRKASIGDAWTGVSRWRPSTQKVIRDVSTAIMGPKAYVYATNAERIIQNVVRDAKILIVVKSVVVPAANVATNILQMISRGVPIMDIYKGVPRKLSEIDSYVKTNLRKIDLEAQIRAADPFEARKLELEVQSINDAHRRLSIWPLIQAGEFSNISDAGVSQEDTLLTEGKWGDYFEQKVNRLPEGVRNAGRYGIITRDTSLFQGLQKSVAYGDFIFKAILYDHLIQKKGRLPSQALAQITEEFVNYDRLPGRTRGYLEDMGLLWFYNYKIRFSKVALSIIRRNPVQALFAAMVPIPLFLGSVVDLPTDGALFMKAYDGKLDYSIGPAQGIGAINLHPLVNLTT
jgi:hypothetical protein